MVLSLTEELFESDGLVTVLNKTQNGYKNWVALVRKRAVQEDLLGSPGWKSHFRNFYLIWEDFCNISVQIAT